MPNKNCDYQLIIIGAGAAGLGASERASKKKLNHVVLEASHRTGGRGLTEYLEETIPVDLGCHWMHSASINPYVKWADHFEEEYEKANYDPMFHFPDKLSGRKSEYVAFQAQCFEKIEKLYKQNPEFSVVDAVDLNSPWADYFSYWMSLMHSNDIDQVAVRDVMAFNDTQEDWPLKNGYGHLISTQGASAPVKLNTAATCIEQMSDHVKVTTNNGTLSAEKIVLTVSTGVLADNSIEFKPGLDSLKINAIQSLPMGNYNYQFFSLEKDALDSDTPTHIQYYDGEVSMMINVMPFATPCVFTCTAGRFAWWLEQQGVEASKDYFSQGLVDIFGAGFRKKLREFKVSAWGYDPWIRGAYSSLLPGSGDMRSVLASPIDDHIYFAGEATSKEFLNTAHGAYISGKDAVNQAFPQ